MRTLDLFAGIGGFSLAASKVWPDHEVAAFCEINNYCQRVLYKHWPQAPIINDIHTMRGNDYGTIGLITAGFPCQPYSLAGLRRGNTDERALWPETLRLIDEARPRWFIGENVAGILSMEQPALFSTLEGQGLGRTENQMVLNDIWSDLERIDYSVQTFVIPALAVGAPHRRDRVWIVAHSSSESGWKKSATRLDLARHPLQETGRHENSNGFAACDRAESTHTAGERFKKVRQNSERPTKRAACGDPACCDSSDTQSKQCQWASSPRRRWSGDPDHRRTNPNTSSTRRQERDTASISSGTGQRCWRTPAPTTPWGRPWIDVAGELCGMADGLPAELDANERKSIYKAIKHFGREEVERTLGLDLRQAEEYAEYVRNRNPRLEALGNSIVSQVAEQIMWGIKNADQPRE